MELYINRQRLNLTINFCTTRIVVSILQQLIDEYFLTALCKLLFESIKRTSNLLCSTCRVTHNALVKTAHNVFGVNWCYFLMQVNTELERIGFKQYPSELVVCIAVELLVASE